MCTTCHISNPLNTVRLNRQYKHYHHARDGDTEVLRDKVSFQITQLKMTELDGLKTTAVSQRVCYLPLLGPHKALPPELLTTRLKTAVSES